MALTLTNPTERPYTGPETWGRTRVVPKLITFDSSYATAGEALNASDFGLTALWDVVVGPRSGYTFEWTPTDAASGVLQAIPSLTELTEVVTQPACVDVTTTGTYTFDGDVPLGSLILGWRANTTVAWTGDTSAVLSIGVAGDLDRFTADATASIFAAGVDGSLALAADAADGISAAVSPVATITTASNFTNANAAASTAVSIIYIPPTLPAADLSTLTGVRAVAYGY